MAKTKTEFHHYKQERKLFLNIINKNAAQFSVSRKEVELATPLV
jgi:hypothetical protein